MSARQHLQARVEFGSRHPLAIGPIIARRCYLRETIPWGHRLPESRTIRQSSGQATALPSSSIEQRTAQVGPLLPGRLVAERDAVPASPLGLVERVIGDRDQAPGGPERARPAES